ncbi:ankyrin repeat-containing domain protein [Sporodiniella umbellata]|nr:ankyrin repeat-containing domain protein [Sporodiniella umbellata]
MVEGKKEKTKDYSLGLHGACTNGNVGLVKFALDHGAPIDSVVNGFMPLQLACISDNHGAVVQYLIDRGADVNAQKWSKKHSTDKSQAVAGATGSTALHVACANGCTKIVDLLLRNGAKIDVKDKYGSRPIDVAAAKNNSEIVSLLETFGAMQEMMQGIQEVDMSRGSPETPQRPVDPVSRAERFRRPSLPSVFESKKLDIPDLSTLPPPRHSINTSRPTAEELKRADDWYSYGVVNHYEDENYLQSLERRTHGINGEGGRTSLDAMRPSMDLVRCSSDRLRTTAIKNAMAANLEETDDTDPRPSFCEDQRPDILPPRKTSWWSTHSNDSRKSMEESSRHRTSLDFTRPSLDGIPQLAKKSMEALSRKSIDVDDYVNIDNKKYTKNGFLSKWWSSNNKKQ